MLNHVADVGHSVWLLTLYNNINAILLFIPMMVIFGELPIIYNYTELFSSTFWIPMSIAGFFGFAIGYVTGLQVKVIKRSILQQSFRQIYKLVALNQWFLNFLEHLL